VILSLEVVSWTEIHLLTKFGGRRVTETAKLGKLKAKRS
jgi:hypothetical protein